MVNGYLFNYTLNLIYNDGHGYLMLYALFCVNCIRFRCQGYIFLGPICCGCFSEE